MYNGKMTEKLKKLYEEYYNIFGVEPSFYEEVEYGDDYEGFLNDVKLAIKEKKELPDVADIEESDW
jgi:hypothetical protein